MTVKSNIKLEASDYVHLHNHTHYSLLDGLSKVGPLVKSVKDMGMEAVAITDHGTMSGVIELYKSAKSQGIKPIIGIEAYVAARSRHDREPNKDKTRYHLTMLAMNQTGYKNLMLLSTKANLEGFYYKPRIDHELLEKYNEGLIVLSGCASGEISQQLRIDDYDKAKEIAKWYKSIFGDRYYIELQDHGHPDSPASWDVQVDLNKKLTKLAKELDIECVLTSDAHYISAEDKDSHEILLCVGTGAFLSDDKRMSLKDFDLHLTDPNEIIDRWIITNPKAVANTKTIADRCNLEIELGGILIPKFGVPKGQTEKTYLDRLVYKGIAIRYIKKLPEEASGMTNEEIRGLLSIEVRNRLDIELSLLDNMGYNAYFLIVQDFVNWGKNRGIIFGPGRGSAAGSIVSYALNITDIDPLEYGLIFERFLNPDRISMPDIDIDIQDTRRDEVIQYCIDKYGYDRVSNIVTFGKMAARAAVRDVARVLEIPYAEADRLSKMIPPPVQGRHIPLAKSIVDDIDLKREYETNQVAKDVFDYAIKLEGTIRSHGVHACGVVIAPDDLTKYLPLEMAQKGVVSTQFSMGDVEDIGLLKMDFLGLSNLTTINNTLRIIKKVYKNDITISNLPLDDKLTYELFQHGNTIGIFQFESAGMRRYLEELKPTVFDDLIAMAALYRPGPMQFIDSFIRRKHGLEKISYLHEKMEPALINTYGVLVYQEQFMQISKDWCGFTGGQADTLRKAVGKKKMDLMMKIKPDFINGAVKHSNVDPSLAEKFWDQLEEFANYCFVKAHSACYAMIAYWTAYLKAHYPDAFMAALMTSDQDDIDRLSIEIAECKHMGIDVLAPDVNESFVEFAIVPGKNKIRFGMAAVKGVGVSAVEEVLRAREDGKFTSIEDFAIRVSTSKFNKRAWDSLIKTGGFDAFGDRSDLMSNLDSIQSFASKSQKDKITGQTDLFSGLSNDQSVRSKINFLAANTQFTQKDYLKWERELLGLYISAHPLDNYDSYFEEQTVALSNIKSDIDGRKVTIGGLINSVRSIVTKSGSKMAFVLIEDKTGECEIVIFPKIYEVIGAKLVQDAVINVSGKVNSKDRDGNLIKDAKIIADEVTIVDDKELENYKPIGKKMNKPKSKPKKAQIAIAKVSTKIDREAITNQQTAAISQKKLYVHIKNTDDHQTLLALRRLCARFVGLVDIILVLGPDKKTAIKLPFQIDGSSELIDELILLTDKECVILQ